MMKDFHSNKKGWQGELERTFEGMNGMNKVYSISDFDERLFDLIDVGKSKSSKERENDDFLAL